MKRKQLAVFQADLKKKRKAIDWEQKDMLEVHATGASRMDVIEDAVDAMEGISGTQTSKFLQLFSNENGNRLRNSYKRAWIVHNSTSHQVNLSQFILKKSRVTSSSRVWKRQCQIASTRLTSGNSRTEKKRSDQVMYLRLIMIAYSIFTRHSCHVLMKSHGYSRSALWEAWWWPKSAWTWFVRTRTTSVNKKF